MIAECWLLGLGASAWDFIHIVTPFFNCRGQNLSVELGFINHWNIDKLVIFGNIWSLSHWNTIGIPLEYHWNTIWINQYLVINVVMKSHWFPLISCQLSHQSSDHQDHQVQSLGKFGRHGCALLWDHSQRNGSVYKVAKTLQVWSIKESCRVFPITLAASFSCLLCVLSTLGQSQRFSLHGAVGARFSISSNSISTSRSFQIIFCLATMPWPFCANFHQGW